MTWLAQAQLLLPGSQLYRFVFSYSASSCPWSIGLVPAGASSLVFIAAQTDDDGVMGSWANRVRIKSIDTQTADRHALYATFTIEAAPSHGPDALQPCCKIVFKTRMRIAADKHFAKGISSSVNLVCNSASPGCEKGAMQSFGIDGIVNQKCERGEIDWSEIS
ncbi:hypothetical protein E5Q_03191 [Mixia osmundae IAM 14324]|uniref:Uncharacterized protein n=2 Tax=Mixia osmundae (strain CBS 9802 / IAM 14324 / JCM 22182 / KY 12970) TaxID=764103 RepID=G7E113_MIXOS|nr:hypothetical protein E5Q_03191 [Mixia osmundae IAM 14324]